jgi:uncharacterized protein
MIGACARAARVLPGGERYLGPATTAAAFVQAQMWNPTTETLLRRYRKGEAGVDGYAEDYAYLASGLLELFQASGDPRWLEWAITLQRRLDELFWDPLGAGWFSTTGQDASVLLRLKEQYDGAEPAASSVAVHNLLLLSKLTSDAGAVERIERTFRLFGPQMGRGVPLMMAALSTYHAGTPQVVVVGDPATADTQGLLDVVRRCYVPSAVIVLVAPRFHARLVRVLPWLGPMSMKDGQATAYFCRDYACQAPTVLPRELMEQLQRGVEG